MPPKIKCNEKLGNIPFLTYKGETVMVPLFCTKERGHDAPAKTSRGTALTRKAGLLYDGNSDETPLQAHEFRYGNLLVVVRPRTNNGAKIAKATAAAKKRVRA